MANNNYGIDSEENNVVKPSKKGTRILQLFSINEKIYNIKYAPLIISLVYFVFGCIWIFYSDNVITRYVGNDVNTLKNMQTYKGWFYVLFTATMLYFMVKSLVKIIMIKEELREKNYKKLLQSEKKLMESMKELKTFAYYDSLSELPNRRFMLEKIENILKTSDDDTKFSFLFIDLDNFKMVNDILGHDYGDQLLKNIAFDLKNCMDGNDIVARLGGDEFLILLRDMHYKEMLENKAKRILNLFSKQWQLCGKEFSITASIGIVTYPYDGTDLQTLYKNVDTAMYQAKYNGKNCFLFFNQDMNDKVSEKMELENKLRKAIKNREFVVYYQPQIEIETMEVKGVEALVRWNHPTEGLIQPAKFIPAAEASGQIVEIDEFVMRTACKQLKTWIDKGYKPITISLNLTSKELLHDNFTMVLREIIKDTGIRAGYLELEITESLFLEDLDVAVGILKELKAIGVRISLDDFGTGYSSLNYLKRLPIDTIKIDKSFMNEITEDSKEEAIAESIIALAHKMNLSVIAEGIETEKQLEFIKEHKCDKAQGYYFSKPIPFDEVEKLLSVPSLYKI